MDSGYVILSRQSGLMNEMQAIANNIANLSTTGFHREGVVFSEYIRGGTSSGQSVSMAAARARHLDFSQGILQPTGGTFDLALEGDGFFVMSTPAGDRLTRSGHFLPGDGGELMTTDGHRVLDEGGAPIFIPPDARDLSVATDGTIGAAGRALGRIGVVKPADLSAMTREGAAMYATPADLEPVEDPRVLQGFLEGSNVNPVVEIARMIEVQRAYELGQSFSDLESRRMSNLIDMLSR